MTDAASPKAARRRPGATARGRTPRRAGRGRARPAATSCPRLAQLPYALHALALEAQVADRDHLVDQQRLRLELGDDAEGEPQLHALAVGPHRRVGEALELGELDHGADQRARLRAPPAVHDERGHRVLAARSGEVEPAVEAQHRGGAGRQPHRAAGRPAEAGGQAQQRRLAGAVGADEPDALARPPPRARRRAAPSGGPRCRERPAGTRRLTSPRSVRVSPDQRGIGLPDVARAETARSQLVHEAGLEPPEQPAARARRRPGCPR